MDRIQGNPLSDHRAISDRRSRSSAIRPDGICDDRLWHPSTAQGHVYLASI